MGKGVCGTAWQTDSPQVVPDVHEFPGHIACDGASNSELVIPIHNKDGQFCALLDLDSPMKDRFSPIDLQGFLPCVAIIEKWLADHEILWFC
jgi:GAF domain-containing protein